MNSIVGNEDVIQKLKRCIRDKCGALQIICGVSGSGKTHIVRSVLQSEGYHPITFDASEKKSIKNYKQKMYDAMSHIQHQRTALFFDEFEALISDNVGARTIIDYLGTFLRKSSEVPVVVACVPSVLNKVLKYARTAKLAVETHVTKCPSYDQLIQLCLCEANQLDIKVSRETIKDKVKMCDGDIRSLIKNVACSDLTSTKLTLSEDHETLFNALMTRTCKNIDQEIKMIESDSFSLIPMMHENYPGMVSRNTHYKIAHSLSECDNLHTNMYATQSWETSYAHFVTGVLIPRLHVTKKASCKYGSLLSKISNRQSKLNSMEKLKEDCNVTTVDQLIALSNMENPNLSKRTQESLKRLIKFY